MDNFPINPYQLGNVPLHDTLLNTFFNSNADLCCILSKEGIFLEVNSVWESTLGYTAQDLKGNHFKNFVHPADLEKTNKEFYEQVQAQEKINFVNRYLSQNKNYHWLEWKGKINPIDNQIYIIARDISQQKNIEIELSLNEKKYQDFFYNNPNPMWIFDLDTLAFLEVNEEAIRQYGYSKEEFLSLTLKDITPEEEFSALIDNIVIANTKYFTEKELWRHIKKDGTIIFVEISARTILYNNKKTRIVILNNVTKRIEAEKALFEAKTKFRILTESSNDLIMRFDKEHRHLYANPATLHYFGIPPENFIGKTHLELGFSEKEFSPWHEKINQVFQSGQKHNEILPINQGKEYMNWSLIPEFDKNGNVVSILSYSKEVTDIIKTQQALEKSEKRLKLINAEKDKFYSIIAHDLRNPFNGFLGLTDLLIDDLPTMQPEEIVEIAGMLNKSAKNLYTLLENLLEWSQVQSGKTIFRPEKIELNDQISFVLDTMEESFKRKKLNITSNLLENIAITADKQMLNAILRNLISNAYKFTPRGGTNEISTWITPDNSVAITIKDSGIGMSETMVQNLFSLSEKTNRKGTEDENSSGLGLLLVKEYIDLHGGTITVNSTEGKGSTFTVTIPN
ncbi:sensor histidine kinase [Flavobacterium luminosum]|uniref:histidine kinase n=1 Tax=Flavobacterium luminosum TaxID=2949086 RepID=A0ABT0TMJ7_9FLAO|nr:PAS domain-containing sensor histidine kinase [Flavobacterium sp. HXWNR70]MCL9808697.1 PAS domain-containing sensor histidine kinase [Flavobacterium sp. HXWNR70]